MPFNAASYLVYSFASRSSLPILPLIIPGTIHPRSHLTRRVYFHTLPYIHLACSLPTPCHVSRSPTVHRLALDVLPASPPLPHKLHTLPVILSLPHFLHATSTAFLRSTEPLPLPKHARGCTSLPRMLASTFPLTLPPRPIRLPFLSSLPRRPLNFPPSSRPFSSHPFPLAIPTFLSTLFRFPCPRIRYMLSTESFPRFRNIFRVVGQRPQARPPPAHPSCLSCELTFHRTGHGNASVCSSASLIHYPFSACIVLTFNTCVASFSLHVAIFPPIPPHHFPFDTLCVLRSRSSDDGDHRCQCEFSM